MLELTRTARFCVNVGKPETSGPITKSRNTFAGWPRMVGMGAYYELEITCRGEPDPSTGYLINISEIDRAVQKFAIPVIQEACSGLLQRSSALVLKQAFLAVQANVLPHATRVRWRLTPYYSLSMNASAIERVVISQQFEFAASHRLHVPQWSDERNREVFGKCNNEHGHGHNYRVEVAVAVPIAEEAAFRLSDLERIVDETIIRRFDHKHLNLDTREFATINPSVENIAKVCFELLRDALAKEGLFAELRQIKVWETEKTCCTYPA